MPLPDALIKKLADGHFHSGPALAAALGVTRSAVWKQVRVLEKLGLDVHRVPGRGYRLAAPLELLDAGAIRAALPAAAARQLPRLMVFGTLDSTNAWLLREAGATPAACLAEHQTAGRGRRGRNWLSPFGANLYLSLAWAFAVLPPHFPALGLAAGVAVARTLERCGIASVGLKWPNDLQVAGRKLGGLLLEMSGEPPGPCRVIIGLGLNCRMPANVVPDQPWIDLQNIAGGNATGRNQLAAAVLDEWLALLPVFAERGFAPFRAAWDKRDVLRGQQVLLRLPDKRIVGEALGVEADGALRLRTASGVQRFYSGDVSVRIAA